MAITYFGAGATPADNGTQAGPGPVAVTPPAAMVAGDLVVLVAQMRARAQPLTISATGGQSWTTGSDITGSPNMRWFWCRYNGTWSADPSVVEVADTAALSVVMHVFRPSASTNLWNIDVTPSGATYAAPSTPFTVTITGVTTTNTSTATLAAWGSIDDNTWGSLAGTGWSAAGNAQYRNLAGNDQSLAFAHYLASTAGSTGNVSLNQATLGGDAGVTWIGSWFEFSSTMAAEVAAFTLTAPATGLLVQRRLVAEPATFTLTGNATGLLAARSLPAALGTFALTGTATGLTTQRRLTADAATLALSGTATGLTLARLLTASAGAFTLTGVGATLTYSGTTGYTLTAATGSFALTGQAATLAAARLLTAGTGTFTLTGVTASLAAARLLSASVASYTLTGVAVTLAYSNVYLGMVRLTARAGAALRLTGARGPANTFYAANGPAVRLTPREPGA